jgi:hypothetical protein
MTADLGLAPAAAVRAGAGGSRLAVLLAGRAEAIRLLRNPLVLLGAVASAALVAWNSWGTVPKWWVSDVQLDSSLLVLAATTLLACHLAAGRVSRDGATALYDTYPMSATARAAAHLIGLAGPLLLAVVVEGAAVAWLDFLGPVGAPRLGVLAQGLLLVALGGALGTALGSALPNPAAAVLTIAALGVVEWDLLNPFGVQVAVPPATAWFFPWTQPVLSGYLPGPIATIPPAAHLAWLAALTGVAAFAGLWRASRGASWRTGWSSGSRAGSRSAAAALAACVAAAGWSGWTLGHPPTASVTAGLASAITHPAQTERCVTQRGVRYCAYPGFGPDVARWAAVVNGVLGLLPAPPADRLTVRQVVDGGVFQAGPGESFDPAAQGQPGQTLKLPEGVGKFVAAEGTDPALVPGSSYPPVYVDLDWSGGVAAAYYQLALAEQTAWWVAGLPTTQRIVNDATPEEMDVLRSSCVPVGQAREAIAIWLSASATKEIRAVFLAGEAWLARLGDPDSALRTTVGWVAGWNGTGATSGYQANLQATAQGGALANAMLALPRQRVEAALGSDWPGWLRPTATDKQLAAALGIPLPGTPPVDKSMTDPLQPAQPICR